MFRAIRRRLTPSLIVSLCALFVALAGTATAAHLITGLQVRDNSLTGSDIRNGSVDGNDISNGAIKIADLNDGTEQALKGDTGAKGDAGPRGDSGAKGETGAKGDTGAPGAKGDAGSDGRDAAMGVGHLVPYDSSAPPLEPPAWGSVRGASIDDANGIQFGPFSNGTDFSGAYTYALRGVRLRDLDKIAYSERYTGGGGTGAAPYVIIAIGSGGNEDAHHVAFSPSTQSGAQPQPDTWQRWVVTQGSVRYDDDPGNNPDMSWSNLIAAHGNDTISYVQIQAGNTGSASNGSTSYVKTATLEANGAAEQFSDYTFGD